MPESIIYVNTLITTLIFDLIRLILAIIIVILGLRIVWRVEKKLDLFFKLITFAFILIVGRQLIRLFINLEIFSFAGWMNWLDIIPSFIILIAFLVMDGVITKLDREKWIWFFNWYSDKKTEMAISVFYFLTGNPVRGFPSTGMNGQNPIQGFCKLARAQFRLSSWIYFRILHWDAETSSAWQ